jgi:hypothetical protein
MDRIYKINRILLRYVKKNSVNPVNLIKF